MARGRNVINQSIALEGGDEIVAMLRKMGDEGEAAAKKLEAALGRPVLQLQGEVPEDDVIRLAVQCAGAGADDVGLSDTTGYANPAQVRRLFTQLRAEIGDKAGAAHMHNTRGLGLANCLAAYDVGVRTFDASLGGLGGCPYAPGASGNAATEDLAFMLEACGVKTGIDIPKLLALRQQVAGWLTGEQTNGTLWRAGLPKNFKGALHG